MAFVHLQADNSRYQHIHNDRQAWSKGWRVYHRHGQYRGRVGERIAQEVEGQAAHEVEGPRRTQGYALTLRGVGGSLSSTDWETKSWNRQWRSDGR